MQLTSNVFQFQLPDGTAQRIMGDVSVVSRTALGVFAVAPIMTAFHVLGITDRTVAEAMNVVPAVVGRWRTGRQPIPSYRVRELRALLELAIRQSELAIEELDRLPETTELSLTREVARGRVEAARRAL